MLGGFDVTKIIDFIKNRPYAAVNAAGAVLMLLTMLFAALAIWGLMACLIATYVIHMYPIVVLVTVTAVNIAAATAVRKRKIGFGIFFTGIGGGIGAMLAVLDTGHEFPVHRAVKIIFLIQIWLIAWLAEGYLLFVSGIHELSLGF